MASVLRQATPDGSTDSAAGSARRLADALDRLQQAAPDVRAAAARQSCCRSASRLSAFARFCRRGRRRSSPCRPISSPTGSRRTPAPASRSFRALDSEDDESLLRFAQAVQAVSPDATGVPISIRAAGDSVVTAFLQAGVYSALANHADPRGNAAPDARRVLTMVPVLLSGLLTFATCAALDLPLNFANIIALPLLFGVGVAFNIYFCDGWRAGETAAAAVQLDAGRPLQCPHHGDGVWRALAVEPSGDRQHGQAADDLAGLELS